METDVIYIGVVVVGLLLLFKLIKKGLKPLLIVALIIFIMSSLFSINLVQDLNEFREKFPITQKLILLKDGNKLLAGFAGKLTGQDVVHLLDDLEIKKLQTAYDRNDSTTLQGPYFKVITTDTRAFSEVGEVVVQNNTLPIAAVFEIITSDNPVYRTLTYLIKKENLPDTQEVRTFLKKQLEEQTGVSTDQEMRDLLFAYIFSAAHRNSMFIVVGFKEHTIAIYPETITFKILRLLPESVTRSIILPMTEAQ